MIAHIYGESDMQGCGQLNNYCWSLGCLDATPWQTWFCNQLSTIPLWGRHRLPVMKHVQMDVPHKIKKEDTRRLNNAEKIKEERWFEEKLFQPCFSNIKLEDVAIKALSFHQTHDIDYAPLSEASMTIPPDIINLLSSLSRALPHTVQSWNGVWWLFLRAFSLLGPRDIELFFVRHWQMESDPRS